MLAHIAKPIFYPESDGKPMAETDLHRDLLLTTIQKLEYAFPDCYVSGNICLYYEEGNPKKMIAPDVLLCRNLKPQTKRVFLAWEDNADIDLVIEFSSFSTKRIDQHTKKDIYARILQVPYYIIFDPLEIYMHVYHLAEGSYRLLEPSLESTEQGYWNLDGLDVKVAIGTNNKFQIFDHDNQEVHDPKERAQIEAERARIEAERARKEAERARKEAERARIEAERAQKEAERARKEALRADNAERENQQLLLRIKELEKG